MSVKWYASIKENNLIVCGGLKVHNKIADTLNFEETKDQNLLWDSLLLVIELLLFVLVEVSPELKVQIR